LDLDLDFISIEWRNRFKTGLKFIWNFEIGLGIEIENLWNWFKI
jgi:hypothetical protein